MYDKVKKITSSTHAIGLTEEGPNEHKVSLAANEVALGGDFILKYEMERLENMFYMEVCPDSKSTTLMLAFVHHPLAFPSTNTSTKSVQNEYIFLLDRSGSMEDALGQKATKIDCLKDLMLLALQSLPVGCKFNIFSFGSRYESLWKQSAVYKDKEIGLAKQYIKRIDADMNGTELFAPMLAILDSVKNPKDTKDSQTQTVKNIILLTDGQVEGEPVVNLISERCKKDEIRVFTIGIGADTSKFFLAFPLYLYVGQEVLTKIAWQGGGISRFTVDGQKLNDIIAELIGYTLYPSITRIDLKFPEDVKVERYHSFENAYEHHYSVVYAAINSTNVNYEVTLQRPDSNAEEIIFLNNASHRMAKGKTLHALFGKQCIAECNLDFSMESKMKRIDTSLKHNILCRETAFVLVDQDQKVFLPELRSELNSESVPMNQMFGGFSGLDGSGRGNTNFLFGGGGETCADPDGFDSVSGEFRGGFGGFSLTRNVPSDAFGAGNVRRSLPSDVFGGGFDQGLDKGSVTRSLPSDVFGGGFDQGLDKGSVTRSLPSDVFGGGFDQGLDKGSVTRSLPSDVFGGGFDQGLDKGSVT